MKKFKEYLKISKKDAIGKDGRAGANSKKALLSFVPSYGILLCFAIFGKIGNEIFFFYSKK